MEGDEPSPGPVNIQQAEEYMKTLEAMFDKFKDLLKENREDALEVTVAAVKRHMANTWPHMAAADTNVVMLTIGKPSCTTLCESLEPPAIMTSDIHSIHPEAYLTKFQLSFIAESHYHMSLTSTIALAGVLLAQCKV